MEQGEVPPLSEGENERRSGDTWASPVHSGKVVNNVTLTNGEGAGKKKRNSKLGKRAPIGVPRWK